VDQEEVFEEHAQIVECSGRVPRRIEAHNGGLQNEHGNGQDHPVRGQDPEGAVPVITPNARKRLSANDRHRKGSVEEEAGQHEEQEHTGRERGRDLGNRASREFAPS
jgi:hypothetical protein